MAKEIHLKEVEKELKDLTECCICLKGFDDPRMLPCIHTFCLKCLTETAANLQKNVGDGLPCPLCRKQFIIPLDGFSALQKNFFIEKLAGMKKMLSASISRNVPCDGCLEDGVLDVPNAEEYCEDCIQHLCRQCSKQHMKFKATKHHTVISVNFTKAEVLTKSFSDNFCRKHKNQELAIFCFNCRIVLCRSCFWEGHSLHSGSSIIKEADTFRQEISESAKELSVCFDRFKKLRDELKEELTDFLQNLLSVESDIFQTAEDLKKLVDSDMNSLLAELNAIKEKRAKEASTLDEEIDLHLTILETHSNYCKYITENGSPADICQAAYDLKLKTDELKQLDPTPKEFQHRHLRVSFAKTDLKDLDQSIVGKMTENTDCVSSLNQEFLVKETSIKNACSSLSLDYNRSLHKSTTTAPSQQKQFSDIKSASNFNVPDLSSTKLTFADSSCSREENTYSVDHEKEKETKEIISEKEIHSSNLTAVMREFKGYRVYEIPAVHMRETIECASNGVDLQLGFKKAQTTEKSENPQNKFLSDAVNPRIGSEKTKTIVKLENSQIKYMPVALDSRLGSEEAKTDWKPKNFYINSNPNQLHSFSTRSQWHRQKDDKKEDSTSITTRLKILAFPSEKRVIENIESTVPTSERVGPVLLRTIQTNKCRGITGFTILNEKMYVVSKESPEVEVFDLIHFEFICRWKVDELEAPTDLTSCSKLSCIYIMDAKYIGQSSKILKVGVNRKLLHSWDVQDNCGCMSVTQESNIIVAVYEKHRICEYAPDGMLLHQLYLPFSGIFHPLHALRLTDSQFLVSCGSVSDPEHRICVVHADSNTGESLVTMSFGGIKGHSSDQVNVPIFLGLDSVGDVLVADWTNNRVLLLSSSLQFKIQLLTNVDGLRHPFRMCISDTNDRLIVSDNNNDMDDGRILVYE